MANIRRKISELTELTSASLNTTLVGVDGGTTYKIELDTLADAVTTRVNILDRDRLSSLESVTSSFETKGRNVISSSAQITAFGFTTSSSNLTSLNSFTSSQSVLNTAFTNGISSRLTTSSFESFSSSVNQRILDATNEQSFNGLISGSSQLTSSYDSRYVISGSITQTTWDNIANKPSGIVSQSTDLSSLNTFTASISTASLVNRLNTIESVSGSWITESETGSFLTSLNGAISSSEQVLGSSGIYSSSAQIQGNIYSAGSSFTFQDLLIGAGTTFGKITTDGSKYISVMPTYNVESARFWTNGNVTIQDGGNYVDNGFRLEVSGSTRIVGSLNTTGGITGSTNFDTIVNKPNLISGSQQISDLGFVTGSYTTINSFNSLTQSFNSISQSFNIISGSVGEVDFNGVVSGSSQLTSSFDGRYTLSGSVQPLPSNLLSSSAQITAFGFISSSTTVDTGSFVTTSSFNAFTASALTTGSNTFSGSQIISGSLFVTGLTSISASFSLPTGSSLLILSGSTIYVDSSGSITGSLSGSIFGIGDVVAFSSSVNSRLNSAGGVAGTISSSAQITTFGFVSGSYETTGRGIISGSSQLTSSYDMRYTLSGSISAVPSGTISGSSQLPIGLISGSSQLTASYDTRYTLSGSVVGGTTPAGTISGSSQLTSSFDLRYLVTGSVTSSINALNTFSASENTKATTLGTYTSSLNIWTSSVATTGSNSFNGNQTITGSLNVSSIAVVSSSFTANSSSLTLNSGSNLYVQNNGIVEITGSLIVSGSTIFKAGGGFEGGEIALAYAPSGSTLTGSAVSVDIYQNRLRIFEGGGNARGIYVDLSKAPNGVSGELLWKASGLVNAGVDVTLGNLKARLASSGNYSLQVSTVSGTYSVYGSSVYSYNGIGGVTLSSPLTITTTPAYLSAGYNFLVAGSTDTWIITDTSAGISWRISLMIGPSFTNNMISIERLV